MYSNQHFNNYIYKNQNDNIESNQNHIKIDTELSKSYFNNNCLNPSNNYNTNINNFSSNNNNIINDSNYNINYSNQNHFSLNENILNSNNNPDKCNKSNLLLNSFSKNFVNLNVNINNDTSLLNNYSINNQNSNFMNNDLYYSNNDFEINENFEDDEISQISSFRKNMLNESNNWKTNRKKTVESKFNDFRRKIKQKLFEKKFEMIVDDFQSSNKNIQMEEPYDINNFILKEEKYNREINALETIKNYKEMGFIKEDIFEFKNFDFKNDISFCKICGEYIYLIDKTLVICSNNCFSFVVEKDVFDNYNLDNFIENFFCCLNQHKRCNSQIEIFYIIDENKQKEIYFDCSKCLFC